MAGNRSPVRDAPPRHTSDLPRPADDGEMGSASYHGARSSLADRWNGPEENAMVIDNVCAPDPGRLDSFAAADIAVRGRAEADGDITSD
ncbi:hypothetical protein CH275_02075 [Rhodococcus sp. 06-235-1A]|nr:hypothetical protein CH275_02075 [Rhodococcus sp. 06-235-1A]